MDIGEVLVPLAGLALFVSRLTPWRSKGNQSKLEEEARSWPRVSIIIPARNEEENLPRLLTSLETLDYPDYEVIVVDDCSTDGTAQVASQFTFVKLIRGAERPNDLRWGGKQWACSQGARVASGSLLLFTDADTVHTSSGLKRAVVDLEESGAGLLSALPYHENPTAWERLLGPFQLLLLAQTAPYATPKKRRVFVIGQYLLFRREIYDLIGGHAAVAEEFAEDLPLANLVLERNIGVRVYRGDERLFEVRMYPTIGDFVRGWRRNFRSGFIYSSPTAGIYATLMIIGITGGAHLTRLGFTLSMLAALYMAWRQRAFGRFNLIGAFLWPFSLGLFCLSATLAVSDMLLRRDLKWKGRSYQ